jgi:predicted Zn-dependent protease
MWLIGILASFLLAIPVVGQQKDSPDANFRSLEKEAALGKGLAEDFRRRTPSVEDPFIRAYVSKVAARLNEFAQIPLPLMIEISGGSDSKLEPVGLPGGYLFIPLRLLAGAQNETELAAPIAHAIAHIATWHATPTEQAGNATGIPLIFIGDVEHYHATASTLVPVGLRKFQKEREAEADRLAAEWMTQSGLADQTFTSGEFATARERAQAIATAVIRVPGPPSLRK